MLYYLYCYKTCAFFLSSEKDLSVENTFILNSNLNTLQNKGFYFASMGTKCNLTSSDPNYGKTKINNISLSGNILIFANFFIEFRRDSYTEAGTFGVSIGGSGMTLAIMVVLKEPAFSYILLEVLDIVEL